MQYRTYIVYMRDEYGEEWGKRFQAEDDYEAHFRAIDYLEQVGIYATIISIRRK